MSIYTLKFRRGTTIPSLVESEPFFKTDTNDFIVGDGSTNITLVKLGSNTGNIALTGDITASNITLSGDLSARNVTLSGNIILGDEVADNISVTGQFSGSLIPSQSAQFDLGSTTKKWNNIHAVSASFDNLSLDGTGVVSGSSQVSYVGLSNIPAGIVSGSSQITITQSQISDLSHTVISSLNSYTSSNDTTNTTQTSRLDHLSTETGSITTEQGIQDSRLDQLSTETGSITSEQTIQDARLDHLSTETGSITSEQAIQDQRLGAIEADSGSYLKTVDISTDTNLAVANTTEVNMILTDDTISAELIGGVVSGSSQINYSSLSGINDNIISASSDSSQVDMIINGGSISANLKGGVVSGSIQILGGSNILSSSNENFNGFSSSVDSRLDTIEGPLSTSIDSRLDLLSALSHSHANKATLDGINQGLSTSDNVTFADGDFTGDVQVTGNLTVLGSAVEISSTELSIEDKLITVASGSADSAASDGAGIEIAGANKSLKWDHNTTSFVLDAKVSSSVGFKGDGSELTGVTATSVDYPNITNKPTLVSGSSQVSYVGLSNIPSGIVSGSSQVDADTITNFDENVEAKLNEEAVHSGSYLGAATTTNLDEGSNFYWTEERFSSSLDDRNILSGSKTNISSLNSYTSSNDTINTTQNSRLDQLSTETGSITTEQSVQDQRLSAIEADSGSYLKTVDISNDTNLAVSDSSQVDMILTNDTLSANLKGGVVSGSEQLSSTFLSKLGDNVLSSSAFSSPSQGTIRATINGINSDVDSGLQTTDTPTFQGISLSTLSEITGSEFSALFISSSNLIGRRELGTSAFLHYSSSISDGNPLVLGTAGAVKSYVDGKIIDASAGDITAAIPTPGGGLAGGGFAGDVSMSIDTGSAHFLGGVSAAGAPNGTVSSSQQVIDHLPTGTVSGSSQISGVTNTQLAGSIANSKLANSSITIDGSAISLGGSVTTLQLGSTGTTALAGNTTTISGGQASAITTNTNKVGYTDALVKTKLDEETVISGSSQVDIHNTTGYVANEHIDHSSITIGSGKGLSGGGTIDTSRSLFLDTGSTHFQQGVELYSSDLVLPTGTISGSSQITITQSQISDLVHTNITSLNSYTSSNDTINTTQNSRLDLLSTETGSISTEQTAQNTNITELFASSSNHEGRIDTLEGDAHENPLTFNDTTQVDLIRAGNVITANIIGGVISGSSQVDADTITNFDSNVKAKLDAETVVSGSSQINADTITNFDSNVKAKLDAETVVSSSAQITSAVTAGDLDMGGNKVLFGNLYSAEGDLPNAGTYHGMFAHVHGTGKGYFAHGGAWKKLLDESSSDTADLTEGTNLYYTDARVKTKLTAEEVVSGSAADVKSFLSISSSDISDVAAFSQSGTYANLRAQATTAGDVGLGNVTNESKGTMFTSPTFTGTPISTTPTSNDDSTKIATTAYVQAELTDLVGTAGSTLDTLGELSASLASDSGSLATLVTTVGTKLAKASNLSDLANASTARTNLGVAIGSDVQAYNSTLAAVAGSTYTGDNAITTLGTIGTGVWQGTAINQTYLSGQSGTNTGDESDASVTVKGIVELATTAETTTGTDTTRAVTPDGLKDGYQGSGNVTTLGTIGTGVWQGTAIADGYLSSNTAHLSGTQTFTGAKSFDEAVNINKTTASTSKTTGALIVDGGVGIAGAVNVGGDVVAFAASDERLKNDIKPIENPIEKINSISGNSFNWNENKQDIYKGKDYGVIAQEIEKVLPELVNTREDGYKAVKYDKLVSLLIEGIKELSKEVDKLKNK
jgi:hypothetical protein